MKCDYVHFVHFVHWTKKLTLVYATHLKSKRFGQCQYQNCWKTLVYFVYCSCWRADVLPKFENHENILWVLWAIIIFRFFVGTCTKSWWDRKHTTRICIQCSNPSFIKSWFISHVWEDSFGCLCSKGKLL